MKKQMFLGASNLIFENARNLRNNLTHTEVILWEYLRQKPLGYKFRRQHPLGIYIADFYCHALKLVIEIDGRVHEDIDTAKKDEIRQKNLEADGLEVLRFKNEAVEKRLNEIITKIENLLLTNKSLKEGYM